VTYAATSTNAHFCSVYSFNLCNKDGHADSYDFETVVSSRNTYIEMISTKFDLIIAYFGEEIKKKTDPMVV
jgi:hypothetical protein